jgi:hypothetical protein
MPAFKGDKPIPSQSHHSDMRIALTFVALALSMQSWPASAQEDAEKSTIAIVGDADRFTIGQDDFCQERAEINSPSGKKFRIASNKSSFFYIRSKIRVHTASYTCEGDYSFMPSPGLLHIIRYTMDGNRCRLEMFESEPGGTPIPMAFKREESRSCLFK